MFFPGLSRSSSGTIISSTRHGALAQAAADATKKAYCDEEQTKTNEPRQTQEFRPRQVNKEVKKLLIVYLNI